MYLLGCINGGVPVAYDLQGLFEEIDSRLAGWFDKEMYGW